MAQAPRSHLDRRLLLLGLIPLAVYAAFYAILDQVRPLGLEFAIIEAQASPAIAAAEAHYRYLWISAFVLSCAASLTIAVGAGLALQVELAARDRPLVLGVAAAVTIAVIVVELLGERWYVAMGLAAGRPVGLFMAIFGNPPDQPGVTATLWVLDRGLDLVKGFGALALVLVGIALILTLGQQSAGEAPEQQAKRLASALARQRTLLHQAAAVYVFALIAMLAWMYWPLPFLADAATEAAYRQVVVGAAILQGVGYSLGIAALYLPPALLLRHRAAALAGAASADPVAKDDWLRAKGLATQPLDQLRQIAALLTPVLVSLLPALKDLWQ